MNKEGRINERIEKELHAAKQAVGGELGCCTADDPTPMTLLEQIRAEKARLSKQHNARIRELTQAENMLANSDAESIIKDAQNTLYKIGGY